MDDHNHRNILGMGESLNSDSTSCQLKREVSFEKLLKKCRFTVMSVFSGSCVWVGSRAVRYESLNSEMSISMMNSYDRGRDFPQNWMFFLTTRITRWQLNETIVGSYTKNSNDFYICESVFHWRKSDIQFPFHWKSLVFELHFISSNWVSSFCSRIDKFGISLCKGTFFNESRLQIQ
jgi:hypothetical protein